MQQFDKLLFAVIDVDEVLVRLHNFEALFELNWSVLLAHVGTELTQVTRRNVYHFFLGDAPDIITTGHGHRMIGLGPFLWWLFWFLLAI